MASWHVEIDVDDAAAHAAFASDRLWCGYAIADLEPPFLAYARVAVARRGADVAACLVLRHPAFNAIVAHGPQGGLASILEHIDLPEQMHVSALEQHLAALRRRVVYDKPLPMLRMVVDGASYRASAHVAAADRLTSVDLVALTNLYAEYPGNAFNPDMLATGVFYGVRDGTRLIAAAGTHVVSARYGIAAIGNIFTRPAVRGQGLASAVTSAVVTELLAGGCADVILNVVRANETARSIYERLGFREHRRHFEGTATCAK